MRLALIGFGVVGQGFAEILQERGDQLAASYGWAGQIVAVGDLLRGSLYHPEGLDPAALLAAGDSFSHYPESAGLQRGWSNEQIIRESNADAVVEVTYTDLKTGEPALLHVRAALESGKHVVTTNKGPIALRYAELRALAAQNGVQIGFEGTVMSGTPAMMLGLRALAGCQISEVRGIFNGTTNYILTQMEDEASYADALAEAQRLGYAEADPTADVEGFDAMGKVLILANTVMGGAISAADVSTQGISHLTQEDIQAAKAAGERWKLIGAARREGGKIVGSVAPRRIPLSDPLAGVMGATNAITFATDLLGDVTLVGPGAGRAATGFALLADLMALER